MDYLNKIRCIINKLIRVFLRSSRVKQKKWIPRIKQIESFRKTNANALILVYLKSHTTAYDGSMNQCIYMKGHTTAHDGSMNQCTKEQHYKGMNK